MVWLVVLSGYPKTGKTTLSRALVKTMQDMARVSTDELRSMLFGERYPSRDERLIFGMVLELSKKLQERGYNVVIDSTAPNNAIRERLLEYSMDKKMLLVLRASEEEIAKRGGEELMHEWDRYWEEPRVDVDVLLDETLETKEDLERIANKVKKIISP